MKRAFALSAVLLAGLSLGLGAVWPAPARAAEPVERVIEVPARRG